VNPSLLVTYAEGKLVASPVLDVDASVFKYRLLDGDQEALELGRALLGAKAAIEAYDVANTPVRANRLSSMDLVEVYRETEESIKAAKEAFEKAIPRDLARRLLEGL
jgi:hypothetical protein